MRDITIADKPGLGICPGARHWCNLHHRHPAGVWLVQGAADAKRSAHPVLAGMGPRALQWHSDTFTLPAGAVQLAGSSATAAQCFGMGYARCAMQFHFAAARTVVADWTQRFRDICDDMWAGWITELAAQAAQHAAQADATSLAIARNRVGLVAP